VAGGLGRRAKVFIRVLGAGEKEAAEGRAPFRSGGAAAKLGFQRWELIRWRGDEPFDQRAVGEIRQRVPVKSLGESGRYVASFSTDWSQVTMSGSCSASQPR
jgi:hypothetical protein